MWFYWILFILPAIGAFITSGATRQLSKLPLHLLAVIFVLVIGLRFEIGVDWGNYLVQLERAGNLTWIEAASTAEPAYELLTWLAATTASGIWLVNLGCAVVFVSGYFAFCRRLPNCWLALTVGVPYMVIVLTMNYTRQGAALGLVLWALSALQDGRVFRFLLFIALAALFHNSAAALMPLGVLAGSRYSWGTLFWVALGSLLAYALFILERQEVLLAGYLGSGMQSEGAWPRVMMNALAGMLFLTVRRYLAIPATEERVWLWISILTLLFVPALVLSPSSTAVDRIALFFMPIQLYSFSYLPSVMKRRSRNLAVSLVVLSYALVQLVWFSLTAYYDSWIPYRFYPLSI